MYSVWVAEIIGLLSLILILVLGIIILKQQNVLRKIFPKSQDLQETDNLLTIKRFEQLIDEVKEAKRRDEVLNRNFREVLKIGLNYIQKVEILRYNPYGDTGGDQSFSLILLNGKDDGFLLTSLHSRSGTRIYTKIIKEGKSEIGLSLEEKQILKKVLEK